jgi:hypothetical protein
MFKITIFLMKSILVILSILYTSLGISQNPIHYNSVSETLLENIIQEKSINAQLAILENASLESLINELNTDSKKIAFWINIYNAFIQIALKEDPESYQDRSRFFSTKRIKIAEENISFDEIEHGILRKSKLKISLGYLRKPFPAEWERKLRVDQVDWRIHFALNCGAKSCPPVTVYHAQNLSTELDYMTTEFLRNNTKFNKENGVAKVTSLFSWFRADFGGISEIKKILKNYDVTPVEPSSLEFTNYDWGLKLNNYISIPN